MFRSVEERDVGSATSSLQLTDNLGVALGTGVVGAVVAFGDDVGWAPGAAVAIAWAVPVVVAVCGVDLSAAFRTSLATLRSGPIPAAS